MFIAFCTITISTATAENSNPTNAAKVLKVCADPNYMPFSHKDQSGYENQIASLIGEELNIPVEYMWFPQRMGFIRNTLKKMSPDGVNHLCDIVMGVPKEFGMAMTTKPYLHSTYALVVLKEGKLKDLTQGNDLVKLPEKQLDDIKIGITERSPGAMWLSIHALYGQMTPYIAQSGDPAEFPGEPMLKGIISGEIDAAIVWGPTAGYFSRAYKDKLRVLPLKSMQGVRFDYSISAAVRFGEKEWRDQVDAILQKNAAKIESIMMAAGVPVIAEDLKVSLHQSR